MSRVCASMASAAWPLSTLVGRMPQWVRSSWRLRLLVALSSTIRRRHIAESSGSRRRTLIYVRALRAEAGCKVKGAPCPSTLSTHIRPPISSTELPGDRQTQPCAAILACRKTHRIA